MNKLKEIWYPWKGHGEPPKGVTGIVLRNGLIITTSESLVEWNHGYTWDDDSDVVAYSLSEIRERVKCKRCHGTGTVFAYDKLFSCDECKSRGYVWRTI